MIQILEKIKCVAAWRVHIFKYLCLVCFGSQNTATMTWFWHKKFNFPVIMMLINPLLYVLHFWFDKIILWLQVNSFDSLLCQNHKMLSCDIQMWFLSFCTITNCWRSQTSIRLLQLYGYFLTNDRYSLTSSGEPTMKGTRWWRASGWTSSILWVPVVARPPACSMRKAMGLHSYSSRSFWETF